MRLMMMRVYVYLDSQAPFFYTSTEPKFSLLLYNCLPYAKFEAPGNVTVDCFTFFPLIVVDFGIRVILCVLSSLPFISNSFSTLYFMQIMTYRRVFNVRQPVMPFKRIGPMAKLCKILVKLLLFYFGFIYFFLYPVPLILCLV